MVTAKLSCSIRFTKGSNVSRFSVRPNSCANFGYITLEIRLGAIVIIPRADIAGVYKPSDSVPKKPRISKRSTVVRSPKMTPANIIGKPTETSWRNRDQTGRVGWTYLAASSVTLSRAIAITANTRCRDGVCQTQAMPKSNSPAVTP